VIQLDIQSSLSSFRLNDWLWIQCRYQCRSWCFADFSMVHRDITQHSDNCQLQKLNIWNTVELSDRHWNLGCSELSHDEYLHYYWHKVIIKLISRLKWQTWHDPLPVTSRVLCSKSNGGVTEDIDIFQFDIILPLHEHDHCFQFTSLLSLLMMFNECLICLRWNDKVSDVS